ncbi:hypothetical protein BOV97_02375 [Solemya velum gill symbiont]|nr:hypothetical protein BOV97_02375 [Solemya velum gill symbiont]OOY57165.1 hypothetical protein BOV99_02790 [Solemya velum gill symbiont]OOY58351.1 hypothetical protein BOW00_03335 [Solemya velum gill symbiont]OOY63473.1 hypothetical protein BOW04_00270 [Solemya velum gill symbiont]OOY66617.1 hypothetical protein BOW05_00270 [Solemya velum gill symbiont]
MVDQMNNIACSHSSRFFSCCFLALTASLALVSTLQAQTCSYPVTPEARYTLDSTTADSSGNSHNPVNSPSLTYNSTDFVEGTHSARRNTAGMQLNDGTFLEDGFITKSLSMYIKPSTLTGTDQVLFEEGNAVNGIILLLNSSGNIQLTVESNSGIRTIESPFPTDGNWHQVGFVYDGNAAVNTSWIYLDGYPVNSASSVGNLSPHIDGGGLFEQFGQAAGAITASQYTGQMDEVTIFSAALTPKNMLDITSCGGSGGGAGEATVADLLTEQGTMECGSDGYLVHTTATTKSTWRTVDLITSAYTQSDDNLDSTINAIGYNVMDNRVWGYNKEDGDGSLSVSVVDNVGNWTTQIIGKAVDLDSLSNLNVGTVDDQGRYCLSPSTSGIHTVQVVDLDPASANYLMKIDNFSVTWPSGQTPDWAFNPIDDHLYAINYNSSVGSDFPKLLQIVVPVLDGDASTMETATVNNLGIALNDGVKDVFGGVYFDDDGYFYAQGNGTGFLYRLDLRDVSGSGFNNANTVIIANGSTSTENDGTRCLSSTVKPPTPLERDFGDINALGINTSLQQDGPRHAVIGLSSSVTDLMIGSSIDVEEDAASNAAATADGSEEGVSFTSSLGDVVTATVSVTNNTGEDARLCAWLDADADSTFEAGERQCSTAADPGGDFDWTLTGGTGNYYSRFRLCDLPGTNTGDCDGPDGVAGNGEVEDYLISYNATAATITTIRLDGMRPDQILAQLDIASMSSQQLFGLLSIWNPEVAASMAEASHAELAEALRNHLDPDSDVTTAALRWETVEENGTVGFYAERRDSPDSQWQRINEKLLPGLIDAPLGGEYMLFDPEAETGQNYQYQLIEQEAWGTQKTYGPYELRLQ